jgi:hypothetical protein
MRARAGRIARAVALGAAVAGAAGCPRLPPPPPRPAVTLVRLDAAAATGGLALRVRFLVHNRGAIALILSAVDWEIVLGEEPLLRGRAQAHRRFGPDERAPIEFAIVIPAPLEQELRAAARVRLRGMVHLEDPAGGAGAPAPFDEEAPLPHQPFIGPTAAR